MRVRFTAPARADLDVIYNHIGKDNPAAASRVITRLIERARSLSENPYEGRETDEPGVRVIVLPRLRYFLFYRVHGDEVHVVHIRHTSRRRPVWW
jgi:toxin ParE1/3/4